MRRDSLDPIREVDGLRALAILPVLAFHLRPWGPLALGWSGVQLFFVISGFLITRILLVTRDEPRYFQNFYVRRTLRIFPIYYLYLVAVSGVALVRHQSLSQLPFYLTYTQTLPIVWQWPIGAPPWTAHTWSLAIEEQFYLVWPLVVWLMRGRSVAGILTATMFAAWSIRFALTLTSRNPYLLDATLPVEMDALAAGGLVACFTQSGVSEAALRSRGMWAMLAGGMMLAALVLRGGFASFATPATWALQPPNSLLITGMSLAFGGLVAATVGGAPYLRWLAWPPLRYIGRRSYGLYMYHFAIFTVVAALFRHYGRASGGWFALQCVIAVGLTLIVAEVSWRVVEQPLLSLKERFAPGSNRLSAPTPGPRRVA